MRTPPETVPWSDAGMAPRRERIFEGVRRCFRPFVNTDGVWQSPPGVNDHEDPRVYIQVALPYLAGDAADRALAHKLLRAPSVRARINNCAFCNEYFLTLFHAAGPLLPEAWAHEFLDPMKGNLCARYATKDLQHHGYNDNHVALATSTLILGGELLNEPAAVAAGRDNLLNFRDTLLRRGFIHEANDCYWPHTLYPLAAVGQFARDPELRELARACEARVWFDLAAHWHPNLGVKPGPSARDYTGGRLFAAHYCVALWTVLGDAFQSPLAGPDYLFEPVPERLSFRWHEPMDDSSWNLGFVSRMAAHAFTVPEKACRLLCGEKAYPFVIEGTHEVGSGMEEYAPAPGAHPIPVPGAIPFPGGLVHTCQYQTRDWALGTASGRMIGGCPNNNFEAVWRKHAPLTRTDQLGMLFAGCTVNGKNVAADREFEQVPGGEPLRGRLVAWFDQCFFAGFQQEGSAILLTRPRIGDSQRLKTLSTTAIFPLPFGNRIDALAFGDEPVADFSGTGDGNELFITDGPVFIGIRFLAPRAQRCAGPRLRAHREGAFGFVDFYLYDGPEIALAETDLARLGGGIFCEVGDRDRFRDAAAFKAHFQSIQILDDQLFMMRQVRVRRPDGSLFGLRWDALADRIIYRMRDNRTYAVPQFRCTGLTAEDLPFLTGDASGFDGFDWAANQARRAVPSAWPEPGRVIGAMSL